MTAITKATKDIVDVAVSTAKGLFVTLRNAFGPSVTLQYPNQRWDLPEGYRGVVAHVADPETGEPKCTACGICVRACPLGIIELTSSKDEETNKRKIETYTLDMSRCMLCNLCVESCPFEALMMADNYELSVYDAKELHFDLKQMLEFGKEMDAKRERGERT